MARESFRFIHASDFHLERPFQDLLDIPDTLRSSLVRAPWKAAESIFEHAIVDQVDFVLLTGDLFNPHSAGPAGAAFLLDQFEELRREKIAVYWCGGTVDDPERWSEAVILPDNVHYFSKSQTETMVFRRNGQPLATIIGRSADGRESVHASEYDFDEDDNYRIAIGYGRCDAESLSTQRIDYWALGSKHQRDVIQKDSPHIRYAGSPQSRCLDEPGAHGCYVVEVDGDRQVSVNKLDLDEFRYSRQTIDADDVSMGRDLRQQIAKRVSKLQSDSPGKHLLIQWNVHLDLEDSNVVGPSAIEDLLQWARREFGHSQPAAWSIDIDVIPPKHLPKKWEEEDSILGDFLRTSKDHRKSNGETISVSTAIDAETPATNVWHSMLHTGDSSDQKALADRATLLGVDLLRGHKIDLVANTRRFGNLETKK